jgi:hypothetical protein
MRFGASRSQLYDAQKSTRAKWELAQEDWDDQARRDFTKTIWEPLDAQVSEVLRAIDQLAVTLTQVRQDCEFPT